ncbi:MAG TPA: LuxR C-terminal-related transcriptional regulator [Kofleriaceae bacterium]
MRLHEIVEMLTGVNDFVGVASVVVEHATALFELHQCTVSLFTAGATPVIVVDNDPDITDAQRQRSVASKRAADPIYGAVVETHASVVSDDLLDHVVYMKLARQLGYAGPDVHIMMLPLLDPHGLLGTIRCARQRNYPAAIRRDLTVVAAHVSVRLTHLGITTSKMTKVSLLSDRQFEVSRLAARGFANHQIAGLLGVSENTVKKHLKAAFARLGVTNRTELAAHLTHVARRSLPPLGTSRTGSIVITRSAS